MIIKVYDSESEKTIKIESKNLDIKKHFHLNTLKEFNSSDLKTFWISKK